MVPEGSGRPAPPCARAALEAAPAAPGDAAAALVLDALGHAVVGTDPQARITFWNPAAERLHQWTRDEVLGLPVLDVTPARGPGDAAAVRAMREGLPWAGECELRRRDGSTFLAQVSHGPVLDEDGRLVGFVTVSEDITERRRLEETLRRSARLDALAVLIAGIAHEINNPLTYARGNVELDALDAEEMARDPATTEGARAVLEEMARRRERTLSGLDRIAKVARDLKRVGEPRRPRRGPEDVDRVVREAVRVVERALPQGVAVSLRLESASQVEADAMELSQVVLNLVLNAADAAGRRAEPRVEVRTRREGDAVVLEVEDNGAGIPADVQPSLFTPFFTTKPEGTGLGLALARRIVADHCGSIGYATREGLGTTFVVRLPAAGSSG